ncbi:MAG: type III pantothenate kinase [Deltaproteobacteria bacterium]|nr:type III pantothenate kinase [Deltaproteobacteria bacterium]
MLLTVDIGNTNVVIGCYRDKRLYKSHRFDTRKNLKANEWRKYFVKQFNDHMGAAPREIKQICVSSVVPKINKKFSTLCERYFRTAPFFVSHQCKLGMAIAVEHPGKVGVDRLVNTAAAYAKYKTDLIVVDMGTATTIDVVIKPGVFIGGIIFPGPALSLQSLYDKASQLPLVPIKKTESIIGKNTAACIQSGIYHGYIGMFEGVIAKMKTELKKEMTVVATGGLSVLFAKATQTINHFEADLTIEGLRMIHEWNRP